MIAVGGDGAGHAAEISGPDVGVGGSRTITLPADPDDLAPARFRANRVPGQAARTERWWLAGSDLIAVAAGRFMPGGAGLPRIVYAAVVVLLLLTRDGYRRRLNLRPVGQSVGVLRVLGAVLLVVAPLAAGSAPAASVVWQAAATPLLLLGARVVSFAVVGRLRRSGKLLEPVLILGSGQVAADITTALVEHPEYGLVPVGSLDSGYDVAGVPMLGPISALGGVAGEQGVGCAIIAFSLERESQLVDVLRTAVVHGIDIYIVPRFFDIGTDLSGTAADEVWGIPLYPVNARRRPAAASAKRLFDVTVAGTAGLLLLPVICLVALLVRLTSTGPVLYRQPRIGQHGRQFDMLKFRTLYVEACSNTEWSTSQDDNQTRVGKWLRRTNLDELPQLWNVIRNDMSLIGPRPERTHFVHQFLGTIPGYAARHRVPGGVTGWAQVNGLRGDTSIEQRVRFDNRYIEHWSLGRDLIILVKTAAAFLKRSS